MLDPQILKVFSDVYFVMKPAGWNCVTAEDYTALATNPKNKLILTWIRDNLKKDDNVNKLEHQYGLLNRLDIETSGIIMISKNLKSYLKYRKDISDHIKTTKIYLALVDGFVEHEFGVIELPLYYNTQSRVTTVSKEKGKFSYTEYIKLQTLINKKTGNTYTLLLVKIKTGRTHQIRVHLKSIGHKIICDKKYETDKTKLYEQCKLSKRLFLHAHYYKIENDVDGYAKIPTDLDEALNALEITEKHTEYQNAFDILKSNVITDTFLNKSIK
jgi:23S rRNA-/tRNA-specific pseudouridylate synthase